ncbi:MAG: mechanosensitive ion channel family protein [Gammaproteobacteria bacterium]|nr:mechanosensitive ion channel family protein [Gammaproteobacteria bacterium]
MCPFSLAVRPQAVRRYLLGWLLLSVLLGSAPLAVAQLKLPLPGATRAEEPAEPASESEQSEPDPRYVSPHATMMTFINAMNRAAAAGEEKDGEARRAAIAEAVSTFDLSRVNPERGEQLGLRLIGILNRLGVYQPWYLWHEADVRGATEQVYFPHPRFDRVLADIDRDELEGELVLARDARGNWRFSASSVASIDALYPKLEPLPIQIGIDERALSSELWLRARMPEALKGERVLTLEYWQWVSLAAFILLGLILDQLFRVLVRAVVRRVTRAQGGEPDPARMRRAVRPAGLFVMAVFWLYVVWLLGLPDLAYTVVQGAARVFAVLACTWFTWRFVDVVIEALLRKASVTATKFDDVLLPLIRTAARIFIVIAALIYGGLSLNIDITPLLASLTIGGVGFAFAAKDTLENFFGSATVLVDQPFGVGDWVKIGDVEGTVETIGFRSTRIRTFYDSLVSIPNANLVRASVDNYGRRHYRRWTTHIGLEYGTSPDKLSAYVEGTRRLIREHPQTRKDYFNVYVHRFSPSSIDILVYVFFSTPDWGAELAARERLILSLIRLADEIGVSFAFPTQTIHLAGHGDVGSDTRGHTAGPAEDDVHASGG